MRRCTLGPLGPRILCLIVLASALPCPGAVVEIPQSAKVVLEGKNLAGEKIDTKNYSSAQLKTIGNQLTGPENLKALLALLKAIQEKDYTPETALQTTQEEKKLIKKDRSGSTEDSETKDRALQLIQAAIRDNISLSQDSRVSENLNEGPTNAFFLKALKASDQPIFEMDLNPWDMGQPLGMGLYEDGIAILMADKQTVVFMGEAYYSFSFNSQVDSFAALKGLIWGLSPTKQGIEMIGFPVVDGIPFITKHAFRFPGDYPGSGRAIGCHDLKFTWFADSTQGLKGISLDKNHDADGNIKRLLDSVIAKGETFQTLALAEAGDPLVVTDKSILDIRFTLGKSYRHLRGTGLTGNLKVARGSARELWVAHDEGLTKFTLLQGGKWIRKLVASHPEQATATDLVLGPDGLPWMLYPATNRLGVFHDNMIKVFDLGEGSAPVQILAGKAKLYIRSAGRASVFVVDPSIKESIGSASEDLEEFQEEKKASTRDSSVKVEQKASKKKIPTGGEGGSSDTSLNLSACFPSDSNGSVTSSTGPSLSSSSSAASSSSTSSSNSQDLSDNTGSGDWQWQTCKLKSINLNHILERHSWGRDDFRGQFNKDAEDGAILKLIDQAVRKPDIVGPSFQEGRFIIGRTFTGEPVGEAYNWATGKMAPTYHLLVVMDARTGLAVTAFPVASLPRWF